MTILVATSVVRGSQQGQSHGGVYLIDLEQQRTAQPIDWNTMDIDWAGRGWDRGLRGICFANDKIYIAASDELFCYSPEFELIKSWRNPFLKHCHEISFWQGSIFITSTAFDAIIAFDVDKEQFHWGLAIETNGFDYRGVPFNPMSDKGPIAMNKLHLNNVFTNENGLYTSGLKSGGMLHFNGRQVSMSATLPAGTHNARPYKNGILFNDTAANRVRYVSKEDESHDIAFKVPEIDPEVVTGKGLDDSRVARAGFGRGLCVVNDRVIAAGSSPSTIALHDVEQRVTGATITLSTDIRNSIHGLEVYPFDWPQSLL